MNKLTEIILPMYANNVANKKVQKNIDNYIKEQGSSYEILADSVSIDVFKEQYFDTFKIKDKLEEKAKTNVVGITIAITLIMGSSGVINTINNKFPMPIVKWIAFYLFSAAVIYMITAGLLAIKVLIKDNKMFFVSLETLASGDQCLRLEYNYCINLNSYQNSIRNNSVFTSYECIRNSLVCMFLILILVSVPIIEPLNPMKQETNLNINYNMQYHFLYSTQAVNFIKTNDVQNLVEDTIMRNLKGYIRKANIGIEIGIVDIPSELFIKCSYNGNTINILLIEVISSFNP